MSLFIRPADLKTDANQMIKLLAASVNPRYDRARFEWLYERNPDGCVRSWVAVDRKTEELVGTAAAIPRRVQIRDRVELAWVLGDFCVAEPYRALGPALQLQRACLAEVASGAIPFCYDFPSARMLAIYRRLAIVPAVHVRRYVRVLRVGPSTLQGLGLPAALAGGVATVANTLLSLRRPRRSVGGLEIESGDWRCRREFSDLGQACALEHGACTYRSAEYLNWRFFANPFQAHELIVARRAGRLLAYVWITSDQEAPAIVDVFGPADGSIIRHLLTGALALLHERGALNVSITLNEGHPWETVLVDLGFRARDRHPIVVYGPKASVPTAAALASPTWLLTSADWST